MNRYGSEFFTSIRRNIKIAYFVASIIPLGILTYFSVIYVLPYLQGEEAVFTSVGIILVLAVVISVLGLALSVKTTNSALSSIQNAYTRLNSLLDVTKLFRDTLYVDVLLESIVMSATELLDAEAGALLLVDDEGMLWYKVALGGGVKKLKARSLKPGEGITGWVFQARESARVNDVTHDERYNPQFYEEAESPVRSILSVPLLHENKAIGVLEVLNKTTGDFTDNDENLIFSLADQAAISISQSRVRESQHADMIQMTEILINAMDHHAPVKKGHAKRVAMFANVIGKEYNLGDEELRRLYFAGVLHDIGLLRFEYLDHWEEAKFKQHTEVGYEMVRPISAWKDIADIILFHHERFDGKGYPTGKKGEEIPLESRIIAVADTFDVLTSEQSYKQQRISVRDAVEEIEKNSGTQFCPGVVSAFTKALEDDRLLKTLEAR